MSFHCYYVFRETISDSNQAPAGEAEEAEEVIIARPSLVCEENLPQNLLPNNLPKMDAATGQYPGEIAIHPQSKYATGLIYFHGVKHCPEGSLPRDAMEHVWFTYHNLETKKIVIGMPESYYDDVGRGQALYVSGLGGDWPAKVFEGFFTKFGKIKCSVLVIDMCSGEQFRWVIMNSFAEAQAVVQGERNGWKFGSRTMEICYAFGPGKAIGLQGRSIRQLYSEQHDELWRDDAVYARAVYEHVTQKLGVNNKWFDTLRSSHFYRPPNSSLSSFAGYVCPEGQTDGGSGKGEKRLFRPAKFSTYFEAKLPQLLAEWTARIEHYEAEAAANEDTFAHSEYQVEQQDESTNFTQSSTDASSPRSDSTIVTRVAPTVTAASVLATPSAIITTPTVPAPSNQASSSWANVAATTIARTSTPLMIDLHRDGRPGGSAPRVQAPATTRVVPYIQGEPIAEQMRVVIIYNLPAFVTLKDVSEAIREGPLLSIRFANDADTGARFCGIVFQYARDANAFYQVLVQERANDTPGRFRFIVEAGQGPPYPYDEELETMEEPMHASRRLTVVKSRFFFQLGKKQLRRLCGEIAGGADKVQLIWLYNGGNATVVFSDVKSAVAVKTKFDQMERSKATYGNNMASFQGVTTTFSKDPCFTDMNLITDIPDLNED